MGAQGPMVCLGPRPIFEGNPAADQTAPTGYVRPLTKAEAREAAAIAQINEVLSSNPDFQRCTSDGTPDRNGTLEIERASRLIFQNMRYPAF
jgi:hypothetical protein